MRPDALPRFQAGIIEEPQVALPHARMRRLVAEVMTTGGLPGVTVEKVGEQLPASAGNDFLGAEHVRTTILSDDLAAAYTLALRRGYAKLADLERDDTREAVTFIARAGQRESVVAEHLQRIIVPQLVAARARHSS